MNDLITKTIRVTQDILSQEVSGETVFLDLNSENYFSLDSIGTRIWQLLQENGDLNEARLELQRTDQPLCEARESFESSDFKEAVAIFFAAGQGACENTPF